MKQKLIGIHTRISERQNGMLQKLSDVSMKSKADLIREAIELLFKPTK